MVGADGLHSTVRRLAFGPEEQFASHLGLYIATVVLDRVASDLHTVLIHNAPGRAVAIHPTTGREGAAFIFRHPLLSAADGRDVEKQKHLLSTIYHGMGWRVPELLDRVRAGNHLPRDDLYFDSVTRVRLDRWSQGRVVLIGDAADCVSLLGEGSSMALVGAAALAEQLAAQPTDTPAALQHYERAHRRRLRPHHRGASIAGHFLGPATRPGLALRHAAFAAGATAGGVLERIRPRPPAP